MIIAYRQAGLNKLVTEKIKSCIIKTAGFGMGISLGAEKPYFEKTLRSRRRASYIYVSFIATSELARSPHKSDNPRRLFRE